MLGPDAESNEPTKELQVKQSSQCSAYTPGDWA